MNRFRTLILLAALGTTMPQAADAAFVRHKTEAVVTTTIAQPMAGIGEGPTAPTASSLKIANPVRQKRGFLHRLHNRLAAAAGKSQIVALMLTGLVIGIHRFYLGYTWQGIVQLFTFGGFGIWVFIDAIRILIGDLQPKDGSYDSGWSY